MDSLVSGLSHDYCYDDCVLAVMLENRQWKMVSVLWLWSSR